MKLAFIAAAVLLTTAAPAIARPHYTDPGMQIAPASAGRAYCGKRAQGKSHNTALNEAIRQNTTRAFGGQQHISSSPGRAGRADEIQFASLVGQWCPKADNLDWIDRMSGYRPRLRTSAINAPQAGQRLTYATPLPTVSEKRADCSAKVSAAPRADRLRVLMSECR